MIQHKIQACESTDDDLYNDNDNNIHDIVTANRRYETHRLKQENDKNSNHNKMIL